MNDLGKQYMWPSTRNSALKMSSSPLLEMPPIILQKHPLCKTLSSFSKYLIQYISSKDCEGSPQENMHCKDVELTSHKNPQKLKLQSVGISPQLSLPKLLKQPN